MLGNLPGGAEGKPLPGAVELIARLHQMDAKLALFTNGSSLPPAGYAERLRGSGIAVEDNKFLTPASVAVHYLAEHHAGAPVLVIGGAGVSDPLARSGIEIASFDAHNKATAVLIGWDLEFNHAKLEAACRAVWAGAELLVTSDSRTFAGRGGPQIGLAGAIAAGITHVTEVPAKVLGKPSRLAMNAVLKTLDVTAAELVVVGDDPCLEIKMGRDAGALTVRVLSGISAPRDAFHPDFVMQDVAELLARLDEIIAAHDRR